LPFIEHTAEHDVLLPNANSRLIVYSQPAADVAGQRIDAFRCPTSQMEDADPNPSLIESTTSLRFGTSNYRGCRGIRDDARQDLARSVAYWGNSFRPSFQSPAEIRALIGVLYPAQRVRKPTKIANIQDGTSHTIAIGEVDELPDANIAVGGLEKWRTTQGASDGEPAWPMWPGSHGDKDHNLFNMWDPARSSVNAADRDAATSNHPGGVNFAYCDGSVRFLNESIAWDVFAAQGTRAGGEQLAGSD
jgi:prepilin-type processing-associated H-X9-DG protein